MMETLHSYITHINTDPFLVFFGSFYLVLGLSCFFAKKPWEEFIALLIQHDALSLILGILVLPIALFIIVFYNNWDSLASIVLMVMGYLGFCKAVFLLLWPKLFQRFFEKRFCTQMALAGWNIRNDPRRGNADFVMEKIWAY